MRTAEHDAIVVEQRALASAFMNRYMIADFYLPKHVDNPGALHLLLINDGQDLPEMRFAEWFNGLQQSGQMAPLLCVAIHAGKDRRNEYGTAGVPDFAGRGARAGAYRSFIMEELLPFIHAQYAISSFASKGFCGFSLGGLFALDTVWHFPDVFSIAGVFSGSLWWRSHDLGAGYDDDRHRIMHQQIRKGSHAPGLRFYFTTGSLDETDDRNGNGIIDSIDDTLDLIRELNAHGYSEPADIRYINFEDGRHDVATWGRAMPAFFLWAFPPAQEA